MILTNDEDIAKKINSAIFPGIQGGPLMHVIAAKAVAFGEALRPDFKVYAKNVIENAKAMGEVLVRLGFALVSGGTDTHLILRRPAAEEADRQHLREGAGPRATSPATRTACRSIPRSRWSRRASASARRPARRAASASPSSRRSAA